MGRAARGPFARTRTRPGTMDRYAVIGNPVAHSRSPEIHARFARATGEDLVYDRLLVEPGDFARAAREFFASGGRGANVTLPFKVDAFAFAQERTPRAAQAGAVNTLAASGRRHPGRQHRRRRARSRPHREPRPGPFRKAHPAARRGRRRARGRRAPARAPARRARHRQPHAGAGRRARARLRRGRPGAPCRLRRDGRGIRSRGERDVLLHPRRTPRPARERVRPRRHRLRHGLRRAATPFLDGARASGARASDGLGMLVEQAAESFLLWRGKRPDTAAVIAALRAA